MEPSKEELLAGRQLGEALVRLLVVMRHASQAEEAASWEAVNRTPTPVNAISSSSEALSSGQTKTRDDKASSPLLLSVKDAARRLATTDRTLFNLTHPRGPIPSVRFGRNVRYRLSDLEAFIHGHLTAVTDPPGRRSR